MTHTLDPAASTLISPEPSPERTPDIHPDVYPDLTTLTIPSTRGQVILLTGASTGIGFASASYLAERGMFVFATVRRQADAARVGALGEGICPVELDVCDASRIAELSHLITDVLKRSGRTRLDGLINNAGIALGGPLLELNDETLRHQLEVNVIAPMSVIRAFAPLLGVERGSTRGGRVIQVSSISGERAMPFMGPYTASKFALEGLSDSLRMELMPFGVKVISVKPGPINTEIWDKAPALEDNPFMGGLYAHALRRFYNLVIIAGRRGLPPSSIAEVIYHALTTRTPRARYVRSPGYLQRVLLPRLLSTRAFNRLVGKALHLTPERFHTS